MCQFELLSCKFIKIEKKNRVLLWNARLGMEGIKHGYLCWFAFGFVCVVLACVQLPKTYKVKDFRWQVTYPCYMLARCCFHVSSGTWTPHPATSWGTNLRGGTMCFVACQKQSPPGPLHLQHVVLSHYTLLWVGGGPRREIINCPYRQKHDKHLWKRSRGTECKCQTSTHWPLKWVSLSFFLQALGIKVNNNFI